MVDVSRTFTVRQPREVIVAYLRDFSHAEEWDPGTVECTQEDDAPIALGTRWHNKSKLYGISTELTYELTRDDTDHVVFSGSNKTATTSDDLSFTDLGDGTTSVTVESESGLETAYYNLESRLMIFEMRAVAREISELRMVQEEGAA